LDNSVPKGAKNRKESGGESERCDDGLSTDNVGPPRRK